LETIPKIYKELIILHHDYCNTWGWEVSGASTRLMVLRKRGRLMIDERWTYNGLNVEVVDCFNYLGIFFLI